MGCGGQRGRKEQSSNMRLLLLLIEMSPTSSSCEPNYNSNQPASHMQDIVFVSFFLCLPSNTLFLLLFNLVVSAFCVWSITGREGADA